MMSSVAIRQQAQALYLEACDEIVDPIRNHGQLQATGRKIEDLMQKIHVSGHAKENEAALNILIRARNVTVTNASNYSALFNTIFPREPTAIGNAGYGAQQMPMICTYHQKGGLPSTPIGLYRLSPSCLHLLPKEVLKAVGNLDGKRVDLLCQTLDTCMVFHPNYYNKKRPANLYTHHWTFDTVRQGHDVKRQFPMGLFPIWGMRSAQGNTTHPKPSPLAFDKLSNVLVHAHPRGKIMVYSPDTAQFMIDESSPFSITWAVVKDKDERVLITRITMLHNAYRDPIMVAVAGAARNCLHLDGHLRALSNRVQLAIQNVLVPVEQALENDNLDPFQQLPEWHKKNIYKHASSIKGSQGDSINDFNTFELQQALQIHAQELMQILVNEPTMLLNASVDIRSMHDESSQQLIALAEKFDNNDPSAMKDFTKLDLALQKEVILAIWRLNGHPRTDKDFAQKRFASCSNDERARAIYLAVSSKPIASPKLIKAESKDSSFEDRGELSEKLEKLIQRIEALKASSPSPKRTQRLHELFEQLNIDKEIKYSIYDEIGRKAGKPSKERREYGRVHFADSLSSLQKILIAIPKPDKKDSKESHSEMDSGLIEKFDQLIEKIEALKANSPSPKRTQKLHDLFDQLKIDKEIKYAIYEEIGHKAGKLSQDSHEYGRAHFADSLSALQKILSEFMGK